MLLRTKIMKFVLDKISESIGTAIGYPDTTEVLTVSPSVIQIRVRTQEGLRYFSLQLREHV